MQKATSARKEISYHSDETVQVSSTRAVFGAKTYAMANITSVAMHTQPPNRTLPIMVSLLAFLFFVVGLVYILVGQGGVVPLIIGIILFGVTIYLSKRAKRKYIVTIGSASGESQALVSPDRDYIESIVPPVPSQKKFLHTGRSKSKQNKNAARNTV